MKKTNILAYFSDFSLKTKRFCFFLFTCKEEGIQDKSNWFDFLVPALEHLIVFSCLNKMALKQNSVCFFGEKLIYLSFINK